MEHMHAYKPAENDLPRELRMTQSLEKEGEPRQSVILSSKVMISSTTRIRIDAKHYWGGALFSQLGELATMAYLQGYSRQSSVISSPLEYVPSQQFALPGGRPIHNT